ncbi:hypothetical protein QFC19_004545 [Naganishia cerealis]|uniref:Uncharacterized protein n=1 Tax=Naganishia cerealis TaxID=610337 RepID=A0ACC2VUW4_9TREE|nr:hypothetical protein QFC19_004545 [Naganishia cerealis]
MIIVSFSCRLCIPTTVPYDKLKFQHTVGAIASHLRVRRSPPPPSSVSLSSETTPLHKWLAGLYCEHYTASSRGAPTEGDNVRDRRVVLEVSSLVNSDTPFHIGKPDTVQSPEFIASSTKPSAPPIGRSLLDLGSEGNGPQDEQLWESTQRLSQPVNSTTAYPSILTLNASGGMLEMNPRSLQSLEWPPTLAPSCIRMFPEEHAEDSGAYPQTLTLKNSAVWPSIISAGDRPPPTQSENYRLRDLTLSGETTVKVRYYAETKEYVGRYNYKDIAQQNPTYVVSMQREDTPTSPYQLTCRHGGTRFLITIAKQKVFDKPVSTAAQSIEKEWKSPPRFAKSDAQGILRQMRQSLENRLNALRGKSSAKWVCKPSEQDYLIAGVLEFFGGQFLEYVRTNLKDSEGEGNEESEKGQAH